MKTYYNKEKKNDKNNVFSHDFFRKARFLTTYTFNYTYCLQKIFNVYVCILDKTYIQTDLSTLSKNFKRLTNYYIKVKNCHNIQILCYKAYYFKVKS